MSRRLRTLEILAAAQLAPQELARERERTARQSQTTNATLAALSSLIPAGANLAGTLADIDAAKSDRAAKAAEAATAATRQKDLDALNRQNVESQVAERAAQGERAAAEAERKSQTDLRANADKARERALDALRGRAAGGANELDLRRVAMDDDALGDMDDDSVRGVMVAEQEKQAKAQAERAKVEADAEKARRLPPPKPAPRGKGPPSDYDKAMAAAKLRKIEAEAKIAEAAASGGGGKSSPPKPKLTPAEVEGVVELQGARTLLSQLEKMKTGDKIDTGPITNAWDWIRSKVGMGDPKWVEFKALIGTQIAEYIKSISGATVSEPERAQLLQNVPGGGDDDEEFMAKLASVKSLLDNKLAAKKKAFSATGRDTAIFDNAAASSGDDEFDSLPD